MYLYITLYLFRNTDGIMVKKTMCKITTIPSKILSTELSVTFGQDNIRGILSRPCEIWLKITIALILLVCFNVVVMATIVFCFIGARIWLTASGLTFHVECQHWTPLGMSLNIQPKRVTFSDRRLAHNGQTYMHLSFKA